MELLIPIALFAFALYILGGAGRTRVTPAAAGRNGGLLDFAPARRIGDYDLADLKAAFSRFAAERDGRRLDRTPYEGPRVAYTHRSTRAVLSLHIVLRDDGSDDRFTQIAYAVPPGWRHRIELGPLAPDILAETTFAGLARVATEDTEFDRRVRVLSSDASVARSILDAETRRAFLDLRELLANGHVHLSASASRILIRKRGVVADSPELALFARLCDSVYDRLMTVWEREIGIEIIDGPAEPVEEEAPRCQVCSHPIRADRRVHCRRCRTPHHPDCWEFNGGCATFACGERQTLKGAA